MAVLTSGFAASRGSDLALADDTATLTWAELDERVNRLINALRDAGIGSGDTIAVVAGNCN
jgi:long-chain acyl-CoA synthetase